MKRNFFNVQIAALVNAQGVSEEKMSHERLEVYWSQLKDIPEKRFEAGVRWCLTHLNFFPSIAELGQASYTGNAEWANEIIEHKRKAFERKLLAAPMGDQERNAVRVKIRALAIQNAAHMDIRLPNPEPPTLDKSEDQLAKLKVRREFLQKQANELLKGKPH